MRVICCRVTFFLLALAISACESSETGSNDIPASEYINVAEILLQSARTGNYEYIDSKMDWKDLVDRAADGVDVDVDENRRYEIVRQGEAIGLIMSLFGTRDGVKVESRPLQVHLIGDDPSLTVRTMHPSGKVTYCEILMGYNRRHNEVRIRDIYIYELASWVSEILRDGMVRRMSDEDEDKFHARMSDTMQRFLENNPEGAIAMYHRLPPALKEKKPFLLKYMKAAIQAEDSNEYSSAVDSFIHIYPDEPGTRYLVMARHIWLGKREGMLDAITRLDTIVDDPYLKYQRGMEHLAAGDTVTARRWLRSAVLSEPALRAPYWTLMDLHLRDREYKNMIPYLDGWRREYPAPLDTLEEMMRQRSTPGADYANFIQSIEYRRWKRDGEKMQKR